MNEVMWECEACNTENISFRVETVSPSCSGCKKTFGWNDIVHTSDDQDAYYNLIDDISIKHFGKPACDLVDTPDLAVHILQDSFNGNLKPEACLRNVRLAQAKELWGMLKDIPVNEDGEIEAAFLDFEIGTDREAIWSYFEDEFNCSVVEDLMFSSFEK